LKLIYGVLQSPDLSSCSLDQCRLSDLLAQLFSLIYVLTGGVTVHWLPVIWIYVCYIVKAYHFFKWLASPQSLQNLSFEH